MFGTSQVNLIKHKPMSNREHVIPISSDLIRIYFRRLSKLWINKEIQKFVNDFFSWATAYCRSGPNDSLMILNSVPIPHGTTVIKHI